MTTRFFLSAVLLLTLNAHAHATLHTQQLTGEIRLEVKDPSGKAMEAAGKLENLLTGVGRSFQTDAQGKYTLGSLTSAATGWKFPRADSPLSRC